MTISLSVEVPAAPVQEFDVLTELDELQARIRSAEGRAADLQRALASNHRIGIAIGILMRQRRLPEDQAVALLKTESQRRNVKVRELAETVIFTGAL